MSTYKNPWKSLPSLAPYVLAEDLELIKDHKNYPTLHLDTLPEPFIGGLKAEVVLLNLNPGFHQSDVDMNMKSGLFIDMVRKNHINPDSSEFYYFSEGLDFTEGYKWWHKRFKALISYGISEKILAEKIMCIEYFPYHSVNYNHIDTLLPSQIYAFQLAREAIHQNKMIIIMRYKKGWLEAVPELIEYPYLILNNPRNVSISPGNLGHDNYQEILKLLQS